MGLQVQKDVLFLNVSCGHLVNKKREVSSPGYEGRLVGIRRKVERYEGKDNEKVEFRMVDGNELAIIGFTADSYFTVGFLDKIRKVDLSRPFVFGVYGSKTNEKVSYCSLTQDGNQILLDKESEIPQPVAVMVGKNKVMDYTEVFAVLDAEVARITAELDELPDIDQLRTGTVSPKLVEAAETSEPVESDEIPF